MLYRLLFRQVLRRLPPPFTHAAGVATLRAATAPAPIRRRVRTHAFSGRDLTTVEALGKQLPSPLGVAAGLDKDAEWFRALGSIGFGFVEVGTVTPRAQAGNPQPTIMRLPDDHALLNRMGFPSKGADVVQRRLTPRPRDVVVGVNIGKQRTTAVDGAVDDYRSLARQLGPYADYVVVNISSPNTPGLRELGTLAQLEPLLVAVQAELHDRPLLVKISPDASDADIDDVADLAVRLGLAGIVATNTTTVRNGLHTHGPALDAFEGGGVSGPPLAQRSLAVLDRLCARIPHDHANAPILISVGGVSSGEDVWQRVLHGATLVQAYTGFIYGGPTWPARVNRELAYRVRRAGADSIGQLIGTAGS